MGVNNKAREVNTRVFLAHPVLSCAYRYCLHAPATQAIPLPSVRQGSHDPCGDEIGLSQSLIYMPVHMHASVYVRNN